MVAIVNAKTRDTEHALDNEVCDRRDKETQKRININSKEELMKQKVTSSLMLELIQICADDEVPRYVRAIAKVLDNYQGGINTIRSNSIWMSELISQLTDQMRNFHSGQKKIEAKLELILEKVITD